MANPMVYTDAIVACADLVGRAGAREFEIGYIRDDVPTGDAGWYASAIYQGARITVDEHRSPTTAAMALSERLLSGATCRCRRPVTLSDTADGCRWQLVGQRWEPGCDAPSIRVSGQRGDHAAMRRAAAGAAGSSHERRPSPNHANTRRGPGRGHRMPNDPSAERSDT